MRASMAERRRRVVLGDMRTHVHGAQFVHEVGGVISFVGAERQRDGAVGARFDHRQAARRSAWPSAGVRQASTSSPERFSIKAWPRKQSLASMPGPLR